jgi:hypothetical protein
MSTDQGPVDTQLHDRIRRATDHYVFNQPAPSAATRQTRPVGRIASLAAAAAFGVAATLVAIAIIRPAGLLPTGQGSPSPTASPTSPSFASPVPGGTEVPRDVAHRTCLAPPGSIPKEWPVGGESPADVEARFAAMPQIHEEQRPVAALFLFADDRFMVLCEIARRTDGADDFSIVRAVRETNGDPIEEWGATNSPAGSGDGTGPGVNDLLVYGAAAPNVDRVDILLADGSAVEASVADGIWVGWWNSSSPATRVRATLRDGTTFSIHTVTSPAAVPSDGAGGPASSEAPTGG